MRANAFLLIVILYSIVRLYHNLRMPIYLHFFNWNHIVCITLWHPFLIYLIWLHWVLAEACGISFPDQESNPGPLHGGTVLATGPPGKSLWHPSFKNYNKWSALSQATKYSTNTNILMATLYPSIMWMEHNLGLHH